MNFLAHIYLSKDIEQIQIGNFIADNIIGNKYAHYPKTIQTGIILHRHIDTFTDAHWVVKQSKKKMHAHYGHYSGIIIDILYDHFLAKNWDKYHNTPLATYAANFYKTLYKNHAILPERIQDMLGQMQKENWLLHYKDPYGISRVLYHMNIRTKNRVHMQFAIFDLEKHYSALEQEFTIFFEELIAFSNKKLQELYPL